MTNNSHDSFTGLLIMYNRVSLSKKKETKEHAIMEIEKNGNCHSTNNYVKNKVFGRLYA